MLARRQSLHPLVKRKRQWHVSRQVDHHVSVPLAVVVGSSPLPRTRTSGRDTPSFSVSSEKCRPATAGYPERGSERERERHDGMAWAETSIWNVCK